MNERELYEAILEKHPSLIEKIRADERKKVFEEVEELYRDWLYFEYGKKADADNLAIRVINHLKGRKE